MSFGITALLKMLRNHLPDPVVAGQDSASQEAEGGDVAEAMLNYCRQQPERISHRMGEVVKVV